MLEWCLRSPRRPPAFSPLARCCRMVAMCLVGDDAGSTECDRIWATAEVCSSYRSSTHRSPTTTSTLLYLSAPFYPVGFAWWRRAMNSLSRGE